MWSFPHSANSRKLEPKQENIHLEPTYVYKYRIELEGRENKTHIIDLGMIMLLKIQPGTKMARSRIYLSKIPQT